MKTFLLVTAYPIINDLVSVCVFITAGPIRYKPLLEPLSCAIDLKEREVRA